MSENVIAIARSKSNKAQVYFSNKQWDRLNTECEKRDEDRSSLIRRVLIEYFERLDREEQKLELMKQAVQQQGANL